MKEFFTTPIGRLRIVAFLEGLSLIVLVFIAVPLKHLLDKPGLVVAVGPVHGALFLLFIFLTIGAAIEYAWSGKTIAKVIIACFIPFGTFYIDKTILAKQELRS
ncbi:MAG: DUF3817 domain-containing protein [Bacteroidota bacterium]